MNSRLTECNRKGCTCGNHRPVGRCVKPLSPHVRALNFRAEEMHHCSDEFAGFNLIAAICPTGFFDFCLLFRFLYPCRFFCCCRFDCHLRFSFAEWRFRTQWMLILFRWSKSNLTGFRRSAPIVTFAWTKIHDFKGVSWNLSGFYHFFNLYASLTGLSGRDNQ